MEPSTPGMERKDATALRHPDGQDEEESGGGSTETELPPPFEVLVKAWGAASNSDHRAFFDRLGRAKVVAAMSDELLTDFHDHIIGQKINIASKSSSFAVNSTGRLHVMLRCAEQKDLSDEDRGKMIAAGRAMIRDAERRGIIRRAAVLTTELEVLEVRFAKAGEASAADLEVYQRCSNSLRRLPDLRHAAVRRAAERIAGRSKRA